MNKLTHWMIIFVFEKKPNYGNILFTIFGHFGYEIDIIVSGVTHE